MYSFRAGKVVLRWFRFFSPTLANRAVLFQGTAGHAVIRMPCSLHFEEGDYSGRSVVGVGLGLIPGRAGTMWSASSSNADRSGLIGWDGAPDLIRGDEGEGSGGIV
jgi:hypothetical protein